jgi:alpha-beta hydrolase superfamily lysophospholipase
MSKILKAPDQHVIAYHLLEGEKPGLVFLGGFMSDMEGTKARYLEDCCRRWGKQFVRFDYFGHGASSGQFEDGTIGRWLQDSLQVFDALTEGPQILVGSSMGAWLMVLLALARPQRVNALVGIAAAPDFLQDFEHLGGQHRLDLEQKGVCYFPSRYGGRPFAITQNMIDESRQHRILSHSIPVHCPVRLLHGLADLEVSWQQSVALAQKLESLDVSVTLIKGGDHRLAEASQLMLLQETIHLLLS